MPLGILIDLLPFLALVWAAKIVVSESYFYLAAFQCITILGGFAAMGRPWHRVSEEETSENLTGNQLKSTKLKALQLAYLPGVKKWTP